MYVPLRVHGYHSMLTGVDAPRALLERARALALPALALADVDTLTGLVEFLRAAEQVGVQPIVASEISDAQGLPGRVVALATSARGYANLCKLVSARHLGDDPGAAGAVLDAPERFRLVDAVVRFQEGLVLLVDHPRLVLELGGRVDERALFVAISPASLRVRSGDTLAPRNAAHAPHRSAGLEALDERARSKEEQLETPKVPAPEQPVPAARLVEAARAAGLATLAVPDVYAAWPGGVEDHRVRVAIKHNALLADLPDAWTARAPIHLLAAAEMHALYADLPECAGPFAPSDAVARTLDVAARCTWKPELGRILFPTIDLDPGETAYSRLARCAFEGASTRYKPLKPEVVRRLDYELATIENLGFSAYFLLVKRIADFARESGIPSVGRGSAADSLVAYCLRLTDADPLRYRLTFERFLNPSRRDRPDIDLDFCWRRRDEVLEHVYGLFGTERTAMIATIATCGVRAAFREAALVLGVPPAEANKWSRRLPMYHRFEAPSEEEAEQAAELGLVAPRETSAIDVRDGDNPIAALLARTPEARDFPFEDERMQRVLAVASRLVGAPRHYGLHPGGVVVAPGPISDFVPCQRATKGVVVTQYDKDAVEAIGLVKMDLLGNRALTTVDDCVKTLRARGIEIDLEALPEDDPATAQTLFEGRTIGCFQVESPGMRNLLQQMRARNMDDVIQAVALIRPGPAASGMKDAYIRRARGLEPPLAPHPRLTDVLWETHGVMLYQEDVMQVAAALAGMDLSEADLLRRALQKRRPDDLERLARRFVDGCVAQGVERDEALRAWDLVANFASFGFCKAHAVTYGRIAYRAVWLKTHHPAEYLAAFLASETGYYDTRVYVEEARRLGVSILGLDVNKSGATFAVEHMASGRTALRVGLAQLKGLSDDACKTILAARNEDGPFVSLPDFLERTRAHTDEAETLIRCGGFQSLDRTTPELLWRLHLLRAPARKLPRDPSVGLDPRALAECRSTPRARDALRAARARTGGWSGGGIGAGNADLAPGETAALFPEPEVNAVALPRLPDYDEKTRGRIEHELFGLTIAAHPTALFPCPADERRARDHGRRAPIACREIARFTGARVDLRGWPAAKRHVRTADQRTMLFLTLEDESGLAEVVLFPDVYERDGARLAEFGTLVVSGVVEDHMGACTLHAERVW